MKGVLNVDNWNCGYIVLFFLTTGAQPQHTFTEKKPENRSNIYNKKMYGSRTQEQVPCTANFDNLKNNFAFDEKNKLNTNIIVEVWPVKEKSCLLNP